MESLYRIIIKAGADYLLLLIRRSRFITQIIFGIKVLPVEKPDYYFDVTTVVVFKRLSKILGSGLHLLDMGTGSSGIIGLSLWKKLKCDVISSDINPELARLTKQNIDWNKAPITVIKSRFFDSITARIDTVVFNPPYVDTTRGINRGLLKQRRSQWDGGNNGIEVIEDFLEAMGSVNYPLTAYLGINYWHVSRERMVSLLKKQKQVSIRDIYRHYILPVDIYTIRNSK